MIEGYMYPYAVIIQTCIGFGEDELDEEYLTQDEANAAIADLRKDCHPDTTYRIEWRWHT